MIINNIRGNKVLSSFYTPVFTARKSEFKQDKVEFSSKTAILEGKLEEIKKAAQENIDESFIEEGFAEFRKYIKLIEPEKKFDEKYKKALKEFEPKTLVDNLNRSYEFYFNRYVENDSSIDEEQEFEGFTAEYFEKMPTAIFKANLLSLFNILSPLVGIQECKGLTDEALEIYSAIKGIGLSEETIRHTNKIQEEFDIDFVPYDDPKLVKQFYEELAIHHACYGDLPKSINLTESEMFFNPKNELADAIYDNDEDYPEMFFNINSLFANLYANKYAPIMRHLKHELGHHLHSTQTNHQNFSYISLLSIEEQIFLKKLTPENINLNKIKNKKIKEEVKEALAMNIYEAEDSEAHVFKKARILYKNIKELGLNKKDEETLSRIYNNLQVFQSVILNHYRDYALTEPDELIAVAFEASEKVHPSPQMQKLLDFFGMPKLKDRSYLPEEHPVMQKIRDKVCK